MKLVISTVIADKNEENLFDEDIIKEVEATTKTTIN